MATMTRPRANAQRLMDTLVGRALKKNGMMCRSGIKVQVRITPRGEGGFSRTAFVFSNNGSQAGLSSLRALVTQDMDARNNPGYNPLGALSLCECDVERVLKIVFEGNFDDAQTGSMAGRLNDRYDLELPLRVVEA